MANGIPLVVASDQPGMFTIPALGNKSFQLTQWREDDFYDTVWQPIGAITAGTILTYFRDVQSKSKQHCNLVNPSRLPSGSQMVLNRIGLHINQALGQQLAAGGDILKLAHAGAFTFTLNQDRIVAQGALVKFQSGYGITGATTDTTANSFTTGVPSSASAPQLLVALPVEPTDDLGGEIRFDGAAWITAAGGAFTMPTLTSTLGVAITCFLHGLIKRPVGL